MNPDGVAGREDVDRLLEKSENVENGSALEGYGMVVTPVNAHNSSWQEIEDRVKRVPKGLIPFTEVIDEDSYISTSGSSEQALVLQPQAEESYEEAIDRIGAEEALTDLVDVTDSALIHGLVFNDMVPEQKGQSFRYYDGRLMRSDVFNHDSYDDLKNIDPISEMGEGVIRKKVARSYVDAARGTAQLSGEDEAELVQMAAEESDFVDEDEYGGGVSRFQDFMGAVELEGWQWFDGQGSESVGSRLEPGR